MARIVTHFMVLAVIVGCGDLPSKPTFVWLPRSPATTPPRFADGKRHADEWNKPPGPAPATEPGPLARAPFRRAVEAHRAEILQCYERRLQANHDLTGRVVVEYRITGDGDVLSAALVESTMSETKGEVEACIVRRVKAWVFAPTGDGTDAVVRYPYVFRPSD